MNFSSKKRTAVQSTLRDPTIARTCTPPRKRFLRTAIWKARSGWTNRTQYAAHRPHRLSGLHQLDLLHRGPNAQGRAPDPAVATSRNAHAFSRWLRPAHVGEQIMRFTREPGVHRDHHLGHFRFDHVVALAAIQGLGGYCGGWRYRLVCVAGLRL